MADDQHGFGPRHSFFPEQQNEQTVGEAADIASLRQLIKTETPDLILLDWELPGLSLIADRRRFARLRRRQPPPPDHCAQRTT
ncbi:MAG: hypothetical protein R3A10_09465 [Caldilineaceae bacterium]